MKRFITIGAVVAGLAVLLLFFPRRGGETVKPDSGIPVSQAKADRETSEPLPEANARLNGDSGKNKSVTQGTEPDTELAARTNAERDYVAARDERMRLSNEEGNPPVAFFGKVVDQAGNPLQNVAVDLAIIGEYVDPYPEVKTKKLPLQRQTPADGRFEVSGSGLRGKYVQISMLTKAGYEQESWGQTFGSLSTSLDNPAVLTMWSTNIPHEQLITGDVTSAIIPDGRRYGIEITNRAVIEGAEGDLTVWLKRPTIVGLEKYDWSCELTAKGGLLEESSDRPMLIAPATGYNNVLTYHQEAVSNDWTHGLYGKRFYLRLRDGQIFGRITVNLTASPNSKAPAMVRVQYVINPSGSRLLR